MTTSTASDRELLAGHRSGVEGAFGELFRRHRDRLWAVALRTLANPDDAEDVVQETFVSALRDDGYRGDAAVGTWLHRILLNKCIDRMRRPRPVPHPAPATLADPAGRLATRLVLDDALALLVPEQRAALVLVDVQGYTVTEVAQILDVAEGTVKSRCARARLRLADLLGHLREDP